LLFYWCCFVFYMISFPLLSWISLGALTWGELSMRFIIWFWLWFLLNANTYKHFLTHVTNDLIALLWFYFSTTKKILRLSY
jgi:hypothetical protein